MFNVYNNRITGIIMHLGILMIFTNLVKDVLTFEPGFVEPLVNITVAVGRDAAFICHVRHLGGFRVGWVKSDTKAIQAIHEHVITHNHRVSVSQRDMTAWKLNIKSVTEEDGGGYMCQLNTDPMKSQIGYLDVVIPPDFIPEDTSSDVVVPEGSSVKLTCRAKGYPHPNVTWRREDGAEIVLKDITGTKQLGTLFFGEVLKLAKLSRNEMGSYLCIASNGIPPSVSKRITLNIHFHPTIKVRNQLVGSPFENDVTLECDVEASPKSINYWVRDTGEIIVSSPKYATQDITVSLYETHMTVTIRKIQKEDIGSYRCIAKNSLGEVDSNIRLYEIPAQKKNIFSIKYTTNDVLKTYAAKKVQQTDDEELIGSTEEYDDDPSNMHTKQTKTFDNNNNTNNYNNTVMPNQLNNNINNNLNDYYNRANNNRHGSSTNSISGVGIGGANIFSGFANSFVTRKPFPIPDVRGSDNNEVSTVMSSASTFNYFIIINMFVSGFIQFIS